MTSAMAAARLELLVLAATLAKARFGTMEWRCRCRAVTWSPEVLLRRAPRRPERPRGSSSSQSCWDRIVHNPMRSVANAPR